MFLSPPDHTVNTGLKAVWTIMAMDKWLVQ